jgi:hypothetical protein
MNERIKLLAKQAAEVVPEKIWDEIEGMYYVENRFQLNPEKFAELIVRECIATVEGIEPGYKDYRDQIEDAFRRDCVAEIKHKFGVEE